MRNVILALGAAAVMAPAVLAPAAAIAQQRDYRDDNHRGDDRNYRGDDRNYREWRGNDGRTHCRKPDGTTGLVVGGVAGALLGRTVDTRGDRTLGTLGGAAVGALAGRAVERGTSDNRRCR